MHKITLNDGWTLCSPDSCNGAESFPSEAADWLSANVPGDVHSTLLKHGKIDDPFFGLGAEQCRWVEDKIWWYRKSFDFDPDNFSGTALRLVFNGLDTMAAVFLNGAPLGEHTNMFTPAVFDVTGKLRSGKNQIDVRLDPAIARAEAALAAHPMGGRLWYSYNRGRAWVRKAQYATRWDWGPRIVTAGIWKDVELTAYSSARLENVFFRTLRIGDGVAEVAAEIRAECFASCEHLSAVITLSDGSQSIHVRTAVIAGTASSILSVENPVLWWTNGLGEAHLYKAETVLYDGEQELDRYETEFGIRSLRVIQKDEDGSSRFLFELNGERLFAKGANWIPANSMPGELREGTYHSWIALARRANMNMLRVWGGGFYELEWFYRECDRNGILVWQDFMFACSSYPDFDESFMQNVQEEVEFVVTSLRNHACIALWCGNNEIQWIHAQNIWEREDKTLYGARIFNKLMPSILERLDPSRLYWPSSPFGGFDPNSDNEGDKHNWQVWAGQVYPQTPGEKPLQINTPDGVSFKNFAHDMGLFISEFGMHAAPALETLRGCLPPEGLHMGSFHLLCRNRDKRPDRGIMLMEGYTGQPRDLEQYIDYSMLCQAEGLRFGLEHYRRRFPNCGGALIWQLNDCWPALSWSIADFHLRPKAGYYATARAFAPILLSFCDSGRDSISLWGINDNREPYPDTIEIGLADFFGNCEYKTTVQIEIPAGSSVELLRLSKNRMNVSYTNFEILFARSETGQNARALHYFKDYKDLNLPPCALKTNVRYTGGCEAEIEVKTDYMARFVRLACPDNVWLSDNYFDLLPGECRMIKAFLQSGEKFDFHAVALNSKIE